MVTVFGDLYFQPPIAPLLAMARVTERVALGPACCNPFTLHPIEIAGQIAALDAASDGRAYVGLARGAWLGELGIDQARPVEAVVEAAAVVSALLRGDRAGVAGRRFRLPAGVGLQDAPNRPVPLLVGSWGPKLIGSAAGFADEVKIGGSANPALVPVVRAWLDAGSRPAAVADRRHRGPAIVFGAVTVVDEDGDRARAQARAEAAMYLDVVAELDPTIELPTGLAVAIGTTLRAEGAGAAGALIPDDLLGRFVFAGRPDEVAAQAIEILGAGADRVEFGTPHGLSADHGVDLLGEAVLPAIRRAFPADR